VGEIGRFDPDPALRRTSKIIYRTVKYQALLRTQFELKTEQEPKLFDFGHLSRIC
jgi:hypothetical protein